MPAVTRVAAMTTPSDTMERAFQYSTPKRNATMLPATKPLPGSGMPTKRIMNSGP